MADRIIYFRFLPSLALLASLAVSFLTLTACHSTQPTPIAPNLLAAGEFGVARATIRANQIDDRQNRAFLLDRARVGILTLADGYAESALAVFEDVYDVIRTQGLNEGRQAVAVAINEDLKIWKGEPFEQALTLAYIAMANAQVGSWDNARAAAGNALFYLRDFSGAAGDDDLTPEELTVEAAKHDRNPDAGVDLDRGYVVDESDFTLGYYLHAIASQQLGRADEADDYFNRVVQLNPSLSADVKRFRSGDYDTVLVVSYGIGPRKIGTGPDNAVAAFRPRTRSSASPLVVRVDAATTLHPVVTDVNRMARDHRWNNLEDVRLAKSAVGNVLLFGGLIVADQALYTRNRDVAAVAGGLALVGALLRAGAHADTRYNDILPQRYYVVPLTLGASFGDDASADTPPWVPVTLAIRGIPSARLILTGLAASEPSGAARFRYVRLVGGAAGSAPAWAVAGRIRYGNPATGAADPDPLPFILDGRDTQLPTDATLDQYQAAGHVTGVTLAGLQNLYRDRGITWTLEDNAGFAPRHLLEGGSSLVAPDPGTTGFTRLFSGDHPPFRGVTPPPQPQKPQPFD